jgi:hypothetical protein
MRTLRAVFRPGVFVAVVGWSLLILFEQTFGGSHVGGPECFTDHTCGAVPWIPPVVWFGGIVFILVVAIGPLRIGQNILMVRSRRFEGLLWSGGTVALGGVLLAFGIFLATSRTPAYRFHPPLCADLISPAGFDIWTGQPQGRVMLGNDCSPGAVSKVIIDTPPQIVGRRAVPLPIGFPIGAAITLGALVLVRGRGAARPRAHRVTNGIH